MRDGTVKVGRQIDPAGEFRQRPFEIGPGEKMATADPVLDQLSGAVVFDHEPDQKRRRREILGGRTLDDGG